MCVWCFVAPFRRYRDVGWLVMEGVFCRSLLHTRTAMFVVSLYLSVPRALLDEGRSDTVSRNSIDLVVVAMMLAWYTSLPIYPKKRQEGSKLTTPGRRDG